MVHADTESDPLLGERRAETDNVADTNVCSGGSDGGDGIDNPRKWPASFRWAIVLLLTFMAMTVTFNCISVVPIAGHIVSDLSGGRSSRYASILLVTIWELGEAAGPLVIAPLSEKVGRWPVMVVANALFVAFTALGATAGSANLYIATRALCGLAVTSNVLNPAIIGDMFDPEDRGSPMSLVMLAPLMGGAIGSPLGGVIAENLNWRWVAWVSTLLALATEVLLLTCFRETYEPAIMRNRRAGGSGARPGWRTPPVDKKLATGDEAAAAAAAAAVVGEGDSAKLVESVVRPFIVFGSSAVLMMIALFGSVVFAHFYNVSTTLPDILQANYGLSPSMTGMSLITTSVGAVISVAICNSTLDRIYASMKASRGGGVGRPEFRLPMAIAGGVALPAAIALYGWAAQLRLPLPVMLLAAVLVGSALMLAFLPLSAYVVDAFGLYSASAMTGMIVVRCLMGTFLPLLTAPLVDGFGYGWGFTVLAFASLALAPIPAIVLRYGQWWRQFSPYTRSEE